jgi:group I intron endonuclease
VSGVYQWLCIPTGKVYVGSTQNLQKRRSHHLFELRQNRHSNTYLQHAWDKYGESAFLFSVLELCPIERLIEREQYWIDATRCNQRAYGFNRRIVAESDRGLKRGGQALENIRQANKRQDHSHLHTPEAREKARQAAAKRRGVAITDDHKAKLSKAKIGTKRNPESVAHFGATIRRQFASLTPEERARRVAPKGMERVFILTDPEGNEHRILNLSAFCAERGFDRAAFTRIMMGKKKNYKGWTCRRLV